MCKRPIFLEGEGKNIDSSSRDKRTVVRGQEASSPRNFEEGEIPVVETPPQNNMPLSGDHEVARVGRPTTK